MKSILFILLFLGALMLQFALAAHIPAAGSVAFPLFVVLALALVEPSSESLSLWVALAGGILWDVTGSSYLGWAGSMFLATAFFIKFFKARYVRLPLS